MDEPCNSSSSSSSMDSNSYVSLSTSPSSLSNPRSDLSTELRLGLSISTPQHENSTRLVERGRKRNPNTFFVKVYMEGIPIGRKLDLFAHAGYDGLIRALRDMFRTPILGANQSYDPVRGNHILTYEDKEGDWMMVGDVPWEIFLTTVKRLKITRTS
ncbi:auxin-responsive protein IAA4 isoform X3 [Amborella trichopoda]|uniref:auxin-responsive protein IAA4 isoform X3 n=1 Tax=Amborella trichopoda TaxID=13333 RepID=UPI0009BD12F1|nr:auxin-responsive protein IAA4 isoform X3 [Amborella trichopoda]|eukprot:XP_020520565.1 auxin-responsive protein IAA4 isoform X3 [Amborella trichopoda]